MLACPEIQGKSSGSLQRLRVSGLGFRVKGGRLTGLLLRNLD